MTFELEDDGVRFWCSSPFWTRKLLERGARLVDPSQAEHLKRGAEVSEAVPRPPPEAPRG